MPVPACDILQAVEAFEEDSNDLEVLMAHSGTPQDGVFPNYGMDDAPRIFENDRGWTVYLTAGYTVVTAVEIESCKGEIIELDMFWGHCAEDLTYEDLSPIVVAGKRVRSGLYCALRYTYAPYDPDVPGTGETRHPEPDDPEVVGASVFLKGYAERNGEQVPFTLRSTGSAVAELDLSTLEDGDPVRVIKENFSEKVTVNKYYDRFFDGVDFAALDPAALEAELPTRVADWTVPSAGPRPVP